MRYLSGLHTNVMACNVLIVTERVIYPRNAGLMSQRNPVIGGTPITEELAAVCIQIPQTISHIKRNESSWVEGSYARGYTICILFL
jgi:hypothetical protein